MTAVQPGVVMANCVRIKDLHQDATEKLHVLAFTIDYLVRKAMFVPRESPTLFTDSLLAMDNQDHKPIVQSSSRSHITLPNCYSPYTMELLDPASSDDRVIFVHSCQGNTIVGPTDTLASVEIDPTRHEEEVLWVQRSRVVPESV
ncbi:mitochondrial glycerol-3-phosphate dehydrogenase [Steccherinum ochraceum]|uniref:glycerol-3-phosphate dehydrogenase n=1 Tax=Steccherinum ochraceum TaxID=92696 RepID=A0A4R0RJD8_9APHY|nr:mitochondrial glycerol-3-phosphate dehydrogenase [Steccherinum ochraceum]